MKSSPRRPTLSSYLSKQGITLPLGVQIPGRSRTPTSAQSVSLPPQLAHLVEREKASHSQALSVKRDRSQSPPRSSEAVSIADMYHDRSLKFRCPERINGTTVELRSDTFSLPPPEMRLAMAEAIVSDDVWEEDPTVVELEKLAAREFGKEASLYVCSGTMGNLIC